MEQFTVNVPIRDVDAEDVKNAFAATYGYIETIDLGNGIMEPNPVTKEQFVKSCCTQFLLTILKSYFIENAELVARNEASSAASQRAQENIALFDAARIEALPVNSFDNHPTVEEATASISKGDNAVINLVASDPDNLPLTFEVVNQPSNGTVLISDSELLYTPDVNFSGQAVISIKAFNGTKYSPPANVVIDVVSHNPTASALYVSVVKNGTISIDLSGTDPENDSLTYSVDTPSVSGTLFLNDSNTQTYVPDTDFVGEDSFTYKAFDGVYYSDPATVYITVTEE
ncbi:hypothetical protein CCP3SC1AL1_2730001 [Gammaproteobacteria bacterium]